MCYREGEKAARFRESAICDARKGKGSTIWKSVLMKGNGRRLLKTSNLYGLRVLDFKKKRVTSEKRFARDLSKKGDRKSHRRGEKKEGQLFPRGSFSSVPEPPPHNEKRRGVIKKEKGEVRGQLLKVTPYPPRRALGRGSRNDTAFRGEEGFFHRTLISVPRLIGREEKRREGRCCTEERLPTTSR